MMLPIRVLGSALLVGIILLKACQASAQDIWVADGDTIHIDGMPVRFLGIDAPELGQTCHTAKGHAFDCGAMARRALILMLKRGPVRCTTEGGDSYGRTLGHCHVGAIDVNRQMVVAGFARAFVRYSSEYLAEEQAAKAAQKGLWAGSWDAPWEWRAGHPKH